jgi:hypothetical protein
MPDADEAQDRLVIAQPCFTGSLKVSDFIGAVESGDGPTSKRTPAKPAIRSSPITNQTQGIRV